VLIARTDAESATLITSDVDERDRPFVKSSERTVEGFFNVRSGLDAAVAGVLRTHRMRIFYGVRPECRMWRRRGISPKAFTANSQQAARLQLLALL